MSALFWFMLGIAIVLNTFGNVFLREGMKRVGEVSVSGPSQLLGVARKVLREWRVPLGISCMAGFFACYSGALTRVDVSLANPLTAMNIVLGTLYAAFRMGENVSARRWAGIALVSLGAMVAGFSA